MTSRRSLTGGPLAGWLLLLAVACVQQKEELSSTRYQLGLPAGVAYAVMLGTSEHADEIDVFGQTREPASLALLEANGTVAAVVDPGPRIWQQLTGLLGGSPPAQPPPVLITGVADENVAGLIRLATTPWPGRLPVYGFSAQLIALAGRPELRAADCLARLDLREILPDGHVSLGTLAARAIALDRMGAVPTAAWRITGPHRGLLYMPATGSIADLTDQRPTLFDDVDVAILDGRRTAPESPTLPGAGEARQPSLPTLLKFLHEQGLGRISVRFTSLSGEDPARLDAMQRYGELLAVDGWRDWL